ncbi:substrate-binding periplasmic protein [Paludibacterium paludis]|uniref:Solute-binding protein family 3/N-terminal domain-containing protein n=1 Tax=Paludibacterium paludis TaxID=1225769 RepID=A0A918UAE8_9NEIS|nr:transporter substrate-binding domain-containing protein [Paludibacterium paludis]GGY16475.1 hypothetical protein GCM10011289_19690 [Paludibacterium paludis]
MAKRCAGSIVAICLAHACFAEEVVISIQYRDKPPYSYSKEGRPAGFLLERTVEILRRAAVPAKYEQIPVKRIVQDIKDNKKTVCSPGWYKIPDREVFAQFTLAIHQDKPQIVLANVQVAKQIQSMSTFKSLLNNKDYRLGIVSGVSYGPDLDGMINNATTTAMDSNVTPDGLARMIAMHRADYMIIDVEDYNFLLQKKEIDTDRLVVLKFKDIPEGLRRYIMCSKNVSADIMQRINRSIQTVVPGLSP